MAHRLTTREVYAPTLMVVPNEPPFTDPDHTANLVMRVLLGILAIIVCIAPFRLLLRNGEFAAAIFIGSVTVSNIFTVVFALIWHDDNMDSWWPGYGLCDVYPYFFNSCDGLFVTCLLAIMRNLAHQVGLLRVNPLSVKEKRRRNLIEALIIFPLPLTMVAITWPLSLQRYFVVGLRGCMWSALASWPYIIVRLVAPMMVALVTAFYAILTFIRFRQVSKTTMSALSSNRAAALRSQRTKRRLYLMVVSIIVPFLPVLITFTALTMAHSLPLLPYSYKAAHHHDLPDLEFSPPWNTVAFVPSTQIALVLLNTPYISIVTAVPIFVFFGMTKDAINDYRKVCLFFGLGRFWPSLHEEYDPDRRALRSGSSSTAGQRTMSGPFSKGSRLTAHLTSKSSSSDESSGGSHFQSLNFLSASHLESANRDEPTVRHQSFSSSQPSSSTPSTNRFPFRTRLGTTWPSILSLFKRDSKSRPPHKEHQKLRSVPSHPSSLASTLLPPVRAAGSDIALFSLPEEPSRGKKPSVKFESTYSVDSGKYRS